MKDRTEQAPSSARTKSVQNTTTIDRLKAQIDVYPATQHGRGVVDLNASGQEQLFAQSKKGVKTAREAFIEHAVRMSQDPAKAYKGTDEARKSNPKKATIDMEELFGAEGLRLYHAALQEEAESQQYREAVFNESTKFVEGAKWNKPPVVIIGGPSACGKSSATDAVIQQLSQMPQNEKDQSGNLIACVDGGICREVSQMRKFAIRVANLQGYSGIKDLHNESEALEGVKKIVESAALADDQFGLAIPETFSHWRTSSKGEQLLTTMAGLENRELVFTRVVGANDDHFKQSVLQMGTSRAWSSSGVHDVTLDLNSRENLAESKAYGEWGFHFGVDGSEKAHNTYTELQKASDKDDLSMIVVNDLIRVVQNPAPLGDKLSAPTEPESWRPANKSDTNAFLVSERIFNSWNALSPDEKLAQGLKKYNHENKKIIVQMSEPLERRLDEEGQRLQALERGVDPRKENFVSQATLKEKLKAMRSTDEGIELDSSYKL